MPRRPWSRPDAGGNRRVAARRRVAAAHDKAEACSLLGAFVNEVNAQTGKKLTMDQAASFIARTNAIQATLGC